MQHLEVRCAVRPIYWPLGVKWLSTLARGILVIKDGRHFHLTTPAF